MSRGDLSQIGVFLDRDGTVLTEVGYLDTQEKMSLVAGAVDGIRKLNELGVRVVLVSNQSGVARGFFTREFVEETHRVLRKMLAEGKARFDRLYYCPHHPDSGCHCRKPETGMLEQARDELGIDLTRSYVVGDKPEDVMLGRRVSAKTVLVLTGHGGKSELQGRVWADHVSADLPGAVDWIIHDLAGAGET